MVIAAAEPAPQPQPAPSEAEVSVPADGSTIIVSTTAQLLDALGPSRTIELRAGSYDLGAVPHHNSPQVHWGEVHDGLELIIEGVDGLTLRAAPGQDGRPQILARPRYAFVLRFVNVRNLTIAGLILGHTPAGGCTGGVIGLENADGVLIADSDLYGSGTVGLALKRVKHLRFERSAIRECTYGIATLEDTADIEFADSRFADNQEYDLWDLVRSPDVRFRRCTFTGNRTGKGYGYVFFKTDAASSLHLAESTFKDNSFDQLTNEKARLRLDTEAASWAARQLSKPDPQYNQIYAVTRYRSWIVTGTQAGIVFWNLQTGRVDKLIKAYISNSLMVRGSYLWAGTYQSVLRFDGLTAKTYLPSQQTRGGKLIAAPGGKLLVKLDKLAGQPDHWWEYQPQPDRFTPVAGAGPQQAPASLGGARYHLFYDALTRRNGETWGVDFLQGLVKSAGGNTVDIPLRSVAYPGTDPRRLYEDGRGVLWAIDFGRGFFRFDDRRQLFVHEPAVADKGSDMAVDVARGRTWLLHYTTGVYLLRPSQAPQFFDLSRLGYMRGLHLDATDGSLWIGGYNALVHLHQGGGGLWQQQTYVVDGLSVGPGAGP